MTAMTPTLAPPSARMRASTRGLRTLAVTETRLWWRDPGTVFFALAFPAILLIGVAYAIPGMREAMMDAPAPWTGLTAVSVYVPVALATAIATVSLTTMPVTIVTLRDKGVLRRLETTPMRPQALLGVHLAINLVAVLVASTIAVVIAAALFDIPAPRNLGVVVLGFVLGVLAMFSIGMLITARAPRASTASAIGMVAYFPLLFLAGMWTPGPAMPEAVAAVARFTPLGAPSQMMTIGWFESGFPWVQTLVMIAWTALAFPLAARLFRWQ
ncbi:MAG: ABC transporter permease [Cellulomonadaceae bacterium]